LYGSGLGTEESSGNPGASILEEWQAWATSQWILHHWKMDPCSMCWVCSSSDLGLIGAKQGTALVQGKKATICCTHWGSLLGSPFFLCPTAGGRWFPGEETGFLWVVLCAYCMYIFLMQNGVWLSVSGEYKKLGEWWTHCIYIAMLLNRAHHTGMASLVSVLLHIWPCFAWLFSCDQPIWSAKKMLFLSLELIGLPLIYSSPMRKFCFCLLPSLLW
jgi:hypothetical protein